MLFIIILHDQRIIQWLRVLTLTSNKHVNYSFNAIIFCVTLFFFKYYVDLYRFPLVRRRRFDSFQKSLKPILIF